MLSMQLPVTRARATLWRSALLALSLVCPPLQAQTPPSAIQANTLPPLKVAITPSPYGYQDQQGRSHGITPDIVRATAKRLERKVEFTHMPYLRAVHELKSGAIDIMYGVEVKHSISLPTGVVTAKKAHSILPLSLYSVANRGIKIQQWNQAKEYRVGSVLLVPVDQRTDVYGPIDIDYFKDTASLTKALLAKHIDLATLDPVSAASNGTLLGAKLEPVFEYSAMQSFQLFSPASPRIEDPIALCQDFTAARIKLFEGGEYEKILTANNMLYLLPYYKQHEGTPSCLIR